MRGARGLLLAAVMILGSVALGACGEKSSTANSPPVPPAVAKLAFTVQPTTTQALEAIAPAVKVTIEDVEGVRINDATTAVTLAVGSNSFDGILGGTLTTNAIDGIATFPGVTIDRPGVGYQLIASAGAVSVASATFAVHVTFVMVAAGYSHTCGITSLGMMYCWGYNGIGEIPELGDSVIRSTPAPVSGGLSFAGLSAGVYHTCAITTAHVAYCWGYNGDGGLGSGNTINSARLSPIAVTGGLTFLALHSAYRHTCGITSAAEMYCWGTNVSGELGVGNTSSNSNIPVRVLGPLSFAAVSAGPFHTCGLTTSGIAYCWGANDYGQLGTGDSTSSTMPVPVSGGLTFSSITSGGGFTCGLTPAGAAYCWGANGAGNLGNGTTNRSLTPIAVSGELTFSSISAGGGFACGLAIDGAAYCWGENINGQLGIGSTAGSPIPVAVSGGLIFVALNAGLYHACGVTDANLVYCWGYGIDGSLGNGSRNQSNTPVRVVQ